MKAENEQQDETSKSEMKMSVCDLVIVKYRKEIPLVTESDLNKSLNLFNSKVRC